MTGKDLIARLRSPRKYASTNHEAADAETAEWIIGELKKQLAEINQLKKENEDLIVSINNLWRYGK